MMPGMDGFGFLDEFDRLDDSIKKKTRIVMLSTSESFKDLNRANQNKYVNKFLNKPLTEAMLNALNL
jgi:CheY-like chemotaxis protein